MAAPKKLDAATLAKLAQLSRLRVPADKQAEWLVQLGRVFDHMARIEAVDLHGVAPTDHTTAAQSPLRDDCVTPSLPMDEVMRNAPDRLGDGFGVPQILAAGKDE